MTGMLAHDRVGVSMISTVYDWSSRQQQRWAAFRSSCRLAFHRDAGPTRASGQITTTISRSATRSTPWRSIRYLHDHQNGYRRPERPVRVLTLYRGAGRFLRGRVRPAHRPVPVRRE